MSGANFSNYFYLFDDDEKVKFVTGDGSYVDFFQVAKQTLGQVLLNELFLDTLGKTPTELTIKLVGGDQKDFPTAGNANDRVLLKYTDVFNTETFLYGTDGTAYSVRTLDIAKQPDSFYFFDVIQEPVAGSVFKYHKPGQDGNVSSEQYSYLFNCLGWPRRGGVVNGQMINPTRWYVYQGEGNPELGHTPSTLTIKSKLPLFSEYPNDDKLLPYGNFDFKFLEKTSLGVQTIATKGQKTALLDNGKSEQLNKFMDDYIDTFKLANIFIEDVTTMVALPYDFQTMKLDKLDLQAAGIKDKQPKLEKAYNYYDGSYEPVAKALIEQNITDERALPSIYDFLYLGHQNTLKWFVAIPGYKFPIEDLKFIEIYLNEWGKAYQRYYLDKSLPAKALTDVLGLGPNGLEANLIKDSEIPLNTLKTGLGVNEIPGAPGNPIAQPLKQTGYLYLETLKENESPSDVKKKTNPVWLRELKTGVYFKNNSYNTFNEALDKELAFPYFSKIIIPTEDGLGPIANFLNQNDMLDNLNIYAASLTTPTDEITTLYDEYYGGVINGAQSDNFNVVWDLKLTNFKVSLTKSLLEEEDAPADTPAPTGGGMLGGSMSIGQTDAAGMGGFLEAQAAAVQETEEEANQALDLTEEFFEEIAGLTDEELTNEITDFREFSVDIDLEDLKENIYQNVLVYHGEDKGSTSNLGELVKLIGQLKEANFKAQLKDILINDGLLRSANEVRNGKMAHQEILMYEIAKYRVEPEADGEEVYLQSFFLPATQQSQLTYYDTQVIPQTDYFYRIFTHRLVLGTKYRPIKYENNTPPGGDLNHLRITYEVEPYFHIVRSPYYNTRVVNIAVDRTNHTRIEDAPPLPPEVTFVPYRNVNNKLLVLLNNSLGQYEAYPRTIIPGEDDILFDDIYVNQERAVGSKILFKSDDSEGNFEIYRITKPPEFYTDFSTMDTDTTILIGAGSEKDTSFVDTIIPNIDYYYVARFRDIHNKISNPTEVYRVRMIQEQGAMPYLVSDIIDLKELQKKQYDDKFLPVKKMQKYLYIKPN